VRTRVVTVIDQDAVSDLAAEPDGERLWVAAAASGWERRPAGLCRGALCVPLAPGREGEIVRADGAVDLAALARLRGQEVVHDDERSAWLFGTPAEVRAPGSTLEAPDFTLPDLDGRPHSLSAARGRKVLLASWASW